MKQVSFLALILSLMVSLPVLHAAALEDGSLPGVPAIVPGTATADQFIAYNTMPQRLNATAPTGGTQPYAYQWQSSIDNNSFANISGGTDLFYQPGALTTTTWYRQVQYSAGKIDSAYTNTVKIFVYGMAVGDLSASLWNVYPNPAQGVVTLECPSATPAENVTLEVYNAAGEKLFTEPLNGPRNQVSLEKNPPGIYFFKVRLSDRSQIIRVMRK